MKKYILTAFIIIISFWLGYITGNSDKSKQQEAYQAESSACLTDYNVTITPVDKNISKKLLPDAQGKLTISVKITNNTNKDLVSSGTGRGSVWASYKWLDKKTGQQISEGDRFALEHDIAPNSSATAEVIVKFPKETGDYVLRLTMVQEMCAWFNDKNADSKYDINYNVR